MSEWHALDLPDLGSGEGDLVGGLGILGGSLDELQRGCLLTYIPITKTC